jgi:hypothetical protein
VGQVQAAAKQLCVAGRTPEDVAIIYTFCKRQNWRGSFTPGALATHASAALKDAAPRASQLDAQSPPDAAPDIDTSKLILPGNPAYKANRGIS